jgi:(p)ppGpp synthase/HD superfamily hydrolase
MDIAYFQRIEEDYRNIKRAFQTRDHKEVAREIASEFGEMSRKFGDVFEFLVDSFDGEVRRDDVTPLVFHSIYMTRLLYNLGISDEENLLVGALHDVIEDTEITKDTLLAKDFMKGYEGLIGKLDLLTENKNLSRDPDGKNLPPRYREHISRMIGAPVEVVNVEIVDRFSDLMDLEYITEISDEARRKMRLESKMIKTKSFVENVTRDRNDYNENCLALFQYKVKQISDKYNLTAQAELVSA